MPVRKRKRGSKPFSKPRREQILKSIFLAYSTGKFTIASCCESAGCAYETFVAWRENDPSITERYIKAEERASRAEMGRLREKAFKGLERLVDGEDYDEVTKELEVDAQGNARKIVAIKTVRKKVQPNPTACIFALKNADSVRFKDRVQNEVSGPEGRPLEVAPQTVNFIIPDNGRTKPPEPS